MKKDKKNPKPKRMKKSYEGLVGKLLSWLLLLIMVGAMFAGILVYFVS